MPVYEYLCKKCNTTFTTVLTMSEHEHPDVKCPECGSTEVEQQYSDFYAVTSHKS